MVKHIHKYKLKNVVIREIIRALPGPYFSRPETPSVRSIEQVCRCGQIKGGGHAGREDYEIPTPLPMSLRRSLFSW